ncbi:MAG: hypothetical protein COB78_01490 [Hyphomicrobiales bacterium]|nr:MAG: hypothetical protein COB78_01490 [Hyphomicrobiales bacterium]
MSQRINGAILSYALIATKIVITIISTPILVSSLGKSGYGIFIIAGSFVAYLSILDTGLRDTVIRHFVLYETDTPKRDSFLAQMLGFFAAIGILVLAAGWGLRLLAATVFANSLPVSEIKLLQDMITVASLGVACVLAFNPIGALISASERFVFLRSLDIVASIFSATVIIFLLWRGFGALMVVIVMTVSMMIQVFCRLGYASIKLGVSIRIGLPKASELKPIIVYASPIFVAVLVHQIYLRIDNIIIGIMLGGAPVAIYAIGVMFNKYFMSLATTITKLFAPDIIRQLDKGINAEEITNLMIRISRFQALPLLLILTGLFVFGQRFIGLWLGPGYEVSYYVLLAVLGPYCLELMGNARNTVLQVKGLYWYSVTITGIMALINIPLTIFLLNIYGVIGAAISTGLGILVGYVLTAILLQIKVKLDMSRYFIELARGILPACLLSLVIGLWFDSALPIGWNGFLIGVVAYSGVYGVAMLLIGINDYERALMMRAVRSTNHLVRGVLKW